MQVQVAESFCESEYHVYSKGDQAMAFFRLLGVSTRSYSKHIIFKIWLCWDYVHRELVQFVRLHTDLQIVDFSTGP